MSCGRYILVLPAFFFFFLFFLLIVSNVQIFYNYLESIFDIKKYNNLNLICFIIHLLIILDTLINYQSYVRFINQTKYEKLLNYVNSFLLYIFEKMLHCKFLNIVFDYSIVFKWRLQGHLRYKLEIYFFVKILNDLLKFTVYLGLSQIYYQ